MEIFTFSVHTLGPSDLSEIQPLAAGRIEASSSDCWWFSSCRVGEFVQGDSWQPSCGMWKKILHLPATPFGNYSSKKYCGKGGGVEEGTHALTLYQEMPVACI